MKSLLRFLKSLKSYVIISVLILICGVVLYLVLKKDPGVPERALFVIYEGKIKTYCHTDFWKNTMGC